MFAENSLADRINVYDIMSKPVLSVSLEISILYRARMFQQIDLSDAPII